MSSNPALTTPDPDPLRLARTGAMRKRPTPSTARAAAASLRERWRRTVRSLARLGGVSDGNAVTIFNDGDLAFEAMWRDIEGASRRVWLETYRFADDSVGRETRERLIAAAERGCEVVVIFDHFGSLTTPASFFERLHEAGGRTIAFNPVWPWLRRGPLAFRNHRKLLVVDDSRAFCGGMNIADEYAGKRLGNGMFSDCMVRLEGPCAADFGRVFLESWREAADGVAVPPPDRAPEAGSVTVQVVGSNVRRNVRSIQRALHCAVGRSSHRAYLTTPYFLPSVRLQRAMIRAAQRGVDVRILVAGPSDVMFMRQAARYILRRLLRAGIRVYEFGDGVLHKKRATVDGLIGIVGSYNLDQWSERRNLETSVLIMDAGVASDLEEQFRGDIDRAEELTTEQLDQSSIFARGLERIAYHFFRL